MNSATFNEGNPFVNTQGIKAKRSVLCKLTAKARAIQEEMEAQGINFIPRVNSILLKLYSNEPDIRFLTFKTWEKEGYSVKKGAKAYCVWSKPILEKDKKTGDPVEGSEEFYGLAFLFSSKQVEKKVTN